MLTKKLAFVFVLMIGFSLGAQNFFNDSFRTITYTYDNDPYIIYDFTSIYDNASKIKATYFGQDAYDQFLKLKEEKDIVLATTASFSSSMIFTGVSVGFCSENGNILNKMPDKTMDAMVVLQSNSKNNGRIAIGDLDYDEVNFEPSSIFEHTLNPREKVLDTYSFFNLIEEQELSVFQTQLLYSYKKPNASHFNDLYYGAGDRNRRFLAIARKDNSIDNVIIDIPNNDYLMNAANSSKIILEKDGFEVLYLMNLDTGCKDILHVFNGTDLENKRPKQAIRSGTIEHASNLLVYYKE